MHINKLIASFTLILALAFVVSCQNEIQGAQNAKVDTALELSATECTLSQNNSVDEALTISCLDDFLVRH